ncbi:putative ATP-dependent RNA helicase DHX57 [Prorops nasuta]|uniref:putative ATP-dependent RNA helicase DHX57 n=1 Tax=Prorops nasuta TaxID=863751 RepID=UPI0034CDEB79
MDNASIQLMKDIVLNDTNNETGNVSNKGQSPKNKQKHVKSDTLQLPHSKLKVELQTLRISDESEKQLFSTLKHIYGSNFELCDISEYKNKKSNIEKQYWIERGNLVVKGIIDFSSKDNTPKTHEQITRQFATSKLESYSFHSSHCMEALTHTNGHLGKALELLFSKYYRIESILNLADLKNVDKKEILERRSEEKQALESIYGDMFVEKIKNQIWSIQLKLDFLLNKSTNINTKPIQKREEKDVCRLFIHKKCRFGTKCRFLHQQPVQPQKALVTEDPYFTLEIRFTEDCRYPYEPPFFYFFKNDGMYPKLNCLRIVRRLYNECLSLAKDGIPSIFSVISLLENEYEIKEYLEESKEQFLDPSEPLFAEYVDDKIFGASHHELGSVNKIKRSNVSWEEIAKEDDLIQAKFFEKQYNIKYKKMKEIRRNLPAWNEMDKILDALRNNQIIIISGETGCGKSTQVPQFILDDWIINRNESKEHISIICTQPRRISAVGVSARVAAERDENIGNTIGYQIRLESKISNKTRLTFCTTGILLQRLSVNPDLTEITHIIVDEVHERSAESDFLLMLLKDLLSKRKDLKLILMSATLKADAFSSYFGEPPVLSIPGKVFPVKQLFIEDIFEKINYVFEENSKFTRKIKGDWEQFQIELETADFDSYVKNPPKDTILDENLALAQLISRYPGFSKQTYKNLYIMDNEKINYDLIEKTLEWLVFADHKYPKTGSILVFLPGFAEIIAMKNLLNENRYFSQLSKKFIIIPLHSSLSSEEQNLVFKKTNEGVRKIVLSTNLAETSITIDDCVFVIDTGKMKETRFNSNQNMESLETCWVSRANALQRVGRAGRVMPGISIHLYTFFKFKYHFAAQPIPEILRIPLEPLLLRIQLIYQGKNIDVAKILGKMIEPPTSENIKNSKRRLQDVGAFDSSCLLTPLGHHLAALPVNVRIGKLILFGAIFCCLDSALTIAACLSYKSPFTSPFEKRHEVDAKKKEFCTANSDQLTVLKAYKKWQQISLSGYYAGQAFAEQNNLSVRTLQTLADIKYQFLELLVSIGFVPVNLPKRQIGFDKVLEVTGNELNVQNENYKLLQGLLCAALYPNIAKVYTPEKSFQVQAQGAIPIQPKPEELRFRTKDDGYVNIHPSSVNFHTGYFTSPYLVYQEKIKTSKIFIKEISMVPILSLLLFSSYELRIELHDGIFILSLEDGWILFRVESHRVAQLLQRIRVELTKLLEQKMQDPLLNLQNHPNGKQIITTIINIVTRE